MSRNTEIKRAARALAAEKGISYSAARAQVLAARAADPSTATTSTGVPPTAAPDAGAGRVPSAAAGTPAIGRMAADDSPFGDRVTWVIPTVWAGHVSNEEWAVLLDGPVDDQTFRSVPDLPYAPGEEALQVLVRVPALHEDPVAAADLAERWPTLAPVLAWADDAGADWLYLDPNAEPIPGLRSGDTDYDEADLTGTGLYRVVYGAPGALAGPFETVRDMAAATGLHDYRS